MTTWQRLSALVTSDANLMVQIDTYDGQPYVSVIQIGNEKGRGYIAEAVDEDLEAAVNAALDKLEAL